MATSASDTLEPNAPSPGRLALIGQGKPLSPDFAYQGEWLHEAQIFLYRPTQAESPEITAPVDNGKAKSLGFNAAQLASAFNLDIERVFEHNRAGTLYLRVAEVPPSVGAIKAKLFIFEADRCQIGVTIELGLPKGNA